MRYRLHKTITAIALLVPLVFAASAIAQTVPNVTTQMVRVPGLQCSVTEHSPTPLGPPGLGMAYGGSISCLNGVGLKTLTVYAMVQSSTNPVVWYVIGGSTVTTGVRRQNPAHIDTMRAVVKGHHYRIAAVGTVTRNRSSTDGVAVSGTWTP